MCMHSYSRKSQHWNILKEKMPKGRCQCNFIAFLFSYPSSISQNKMLSSLILPFAIISYGFITLIEGDAVKSKPSLNKFKEKEESETTVLSQNYQGTVFIYPPGIRSERDIPVCSKWISQSQSSFDSSPEMTVEDGLPIHHPHHNQNDEARLRLFGNNQNTNATGPEGEDAVDFLHWESACNIIHKRYFYPPVVERLCRCPERTECPWEWSQPPSYPNAPNITSSSSSSSSSPKTSSRGHRDPFTIMLSSRTQAKFCTEVNHALPKCHKKNKLNKGKVPNLVRTVRKERGVEQVPQITVNCFCPPLYRQWNYMGVAEPDYGNGTAEMKEYYRCDRLPRCRTNERCGNIRRDLHFSFYHCTCPRNHLCLPKVYPPESVDDVEEDVNEVLFKGEVVPAYCTPFS